MHTRPISIALSLLTVGVLATPALALDAFRDRRGLFFGLLAGGGGSKADVDGAERQLGFNLRARVGGGVNEQLTLDAEYGFNTHSDDQFSRQLHAFGVNANLFPAKDMGLFFRVGGGLVLGQYEFDGQALGIGDRSESELGLGAGAGVGYEFFANSDLAVGLLVDFQYQSFDEYSLNSLNIGVTATWY
jgi:hypothetical protein